MAEKENVIQEETKVKPAIEIINLHKSYGKKEVLLGLNLEVYPGELFGFIGRNGIGKSTTIDCVIGTKKFNSGTIRIDGYDIRKEPIGAKESFGYVASEPTCYEEMTGYEYLEFIASIYQINEGELQKNSKYLCNRLQLKLDELNNLVSDYSHGMKQKLCLAASLLHSPKIWILDEPTVGLDPFTRSELLNLLKEINENGKTVIIVTHDMNVVGQMAKRVIIIDDNEIVFDDTKDNFFKNEKAINEHHLDLPDTVKILKELNSKLSLNLDIYKYTEVDAYNEIKKVMTNE